MLVAVKEELNSSLQPLIAAILHPDPHTTINDVPKRSVVIDVVWTEEIFDEGDAGKAAGVRRVKSDSDAIIC